MKKKTLIMFAVIGLLFATACGNPKIKNGEEVVAKIDGKEYTADKLYEELKGKYGYTTLMNWIDEEIAEKEIETTDEIESYVDEAIEYYKGYAEAANMSIIEFSANYLGLSGIESEEDLRKFILNDRKLTLAIEKQIGSKIKDSEIEDYYNENYKDLYTYRYILLADDDDAKENIKKIKSALKGKKKDDLVDEFNEQAKKYSTNSDEILVKSATRDKVNEDVWKKLKDLDDYEYSSEISTDEGYYIVLRISKDKAKDIDDVEEEIRNTMAENKLNADQYLGYDALTELRNKYKIAFFDDDLKKGYDDFLKQVEDAKKTSSNSNSNSDSNKK